MDPSDLARWRKAASIACRVRKHVAALLEPGTLLIDASLAGHELIRELGGEPAFPLQISRNHIAAHYCAYLGDPTACAEGDLIKIDCGVHVDGFVADTAMSVDLSEDGRHRPLLDAAQAALDVAIRTAADGVEVHEIGREVEREIRGRGFQPVRNLTGHSVGRWIIHGPPQIPNVPMGRGRLKAGTCIAIEPFATDGQGLIKESGDPHVFMARKNLKRARGADPRVVDAITAFRGLPFGSRDLLDHLPFRAVSETLNLLAHNGSLAVYPPLCEKAGKFVAQFEHTMLVTGDGVEVLTATEDALTEKVPS